MEQTTSMRGRQGLPPLLATAGGIALALYGVARQGVPGVLGALAGLGLALRAARGAGLGAGIAPDAGRHAGGAAASATWSGGSGQPPGSEVVAGMEGDMDSNHPLRPAHRERLFDSDQSRPGPAPSGNQRPVGEQSHVPQALHGGGMGSDSPQGGFRQGGLGVQGHVPQAPHGAGPGPARFTGLPGERDPLQQRLPPDAAAGRGHVPSAPQESSGRGAGDEEFDADYLRWREEQLRRCDEDYRAWRQHKFSADFSEWRARASVRRH